MKYMSEVTVSSGEEKSSKCQKRSTEIWGFKLRGKNWEYGEAKELGADTS